MVLPGKLPSRNAPAAFGGIHWLRPCSTRDAYFLAGSLIPRLASAAAIFCVPGLYLGLFGLAVDSGQSEIDRIVYVHLPASWVAMLAYLATAAFACAGSAFNLRLATMAAQALAPTGLLFAFLSLWAGCLWGKPSWGHWLVWDLRTFAELALVLVYAAYIGLQLAMEDSEQAGRAGAVLVTLGVLCVPINVAAVQSWTAQQLAVQAAATGSSNLDAGEMLALIAVALGFALYAGAAALLRLRCIVLESECRPQPPAQRGSGRS